MKGSTGLAAEAGRKVVGAAGDEAGAEVDEINVTHTRVCLGISCISEIPLECY
jgi:hypothetical protein